MFSWYEQTEDWAQRLEACAAVMVVVTAGSLRSPQLETQVAKALELGKPLVMVHEPGFESRETHRVLPGLRALFDAGAPLPHGADIHIRDVLPGLSGTTTCWTSR